MYRRPGEAIFAYHPASDYIVALTPNKTPRFAMLQKESMVFLARALAHASLSPSSDQGKHELGMVYHRALLFLVTWC